MCLDKNISPRSQSFPRLFSRQSDLFFFLLNFFFFFLPSILWVFTCLDLCHLLFVWKDLMKNCLMYNLGWCRVWCLVTFPSALGVQFVGFFRVFRAITIAPVTFGSLRRLGKHSEELVHHWIGGFHLWHFHKLNSGSIFGGK